MKIPKTPTTLVAEFHDAFGVDIGAQHYPSLLSDERMALRIKLIKEEFEEFIEAVEQGDLVNAFKELADLQYVVSGTAVEMGGNFDAVFEEVHRSNMSKLGADGKPIYREDGKVLKGPNYSVADVATALGL